MSNIQVSITKGFYRGAVVSGVFPLVKGYVDGARGGFITIKNVNHAAGTPMAQRIQVEQGDFKLLDEAGSDLPAYVIVPGGTTSMQATRAAPTTDFASVFMESETEEEAMIRHRDTFAMLDKITDACASGTVRGLVVSGPPGIGKSFGVEKQLAAANLFRTIGGDEPRYEIISGGISAVVLYQKLYHNRHPEQVLMFDDCDEVLEDSEMLNLLKAALNSGDKRRICWNKESRVLLNGDIPNSFDFEGSVMFLSNKDFDREIARNSKIAVHLAAILSRCHYMDLEISSTRDKLLRIKQVVNDGMLDSFNFTDEQKGEVIAFVFDNAEYLREISLRMVKKVADFVKTDPDDWYALAESFCLVRDAKFKRLHARKEAEKSIVELIPA